MNIHATHRKGLGGFWVTDHFQYRQWDRKITDQALLPVLKELKEDAVRSGMVIVPIATKDLKHNALFIKVKSNVLITCFVSNLSEYRGKNRRDRFYLSHQILGLSQSNK